MEHNLGHIPIHRKSGTEPFHHNGHLHGFDLLDFWRWSSSDLLNNTMRGIVAEYLVSRALSDKEEVRGEWDTFDVLTRNNVRVEVKSSAYLQRWHQNTFSRISFRIPHTLGWDETTNTYTTEQKRHADLYIFCLLHHKDKATVDPLDTSQWTFFVIPTESLDRELGAQKTISLSGLHRIGVEETSYEGLADLVERVMKDIIR